MGRIDLATVHPILLLPHNAGLWVEVNILD